MKPFMGRLLLVQGFLYDPDKSTEFPAAAKLFDKSWGGPTAPTGRYLFMATGLSYCCSYRAKGLKALVYES